MKKRFELTAIFLKKQAEEGSPRAMLDYSLFLLLNMESKKFALPWFEKQLKLSNGYALWRASGIFAEVFDYLGDYDWYEWSMKCLKRSAWKQFKLSKMMLKDMKEHPFEFPRA